MYNGQNNQFGNNRQPFFTTGVGIEPPSRNTFEPENNLDLTNQPSWSENRDSRNIGSRAILSPESTGFSPDQSAEQVSEPESPYENANFGEVIDLAPPPANLPPSTSIAPQYNSHNIRTEGDHLHKTTLSEINHVISEFNQTGNASNFYASVRGDDDIPGMMRENLKNSYHREVA